MITVLPRPLSCLIWRASAKPSVAGILASTNTSRNGFAASWA